MKRQDRRLGPLGSGKKRRRNEIGKERQSGKMRGGLDALEERERGADAVVAAMEGLGAVS